jgi:hypothetical protein
MNSKRTLQTLSLTAVLLALIPAVSFAQTTADPRQQQLANAHSATQKAGLATLGVTALLGGLLAVDTPILGNEACAQSCGGIGKAGWETLSIVHFGFAAATLALWLSSEVLAEQMDQNPYYTGDLGLQREKQTLRWVNVGLFAAQPVLGLLAAHPGLIGIPPEARPMFSRVMRTLHVAVGVGVASSYTATAALQW